MATAPRTIEVNDDSEIARLLDEADAGGAGLLIIKNGIRYRLDREQETEDIWVGYDPEAARRSILEAAGTWKDIDAEAYKAYIRERRRTSSRPPVKW